MPNNIDAIAYIPLIATSVVALILCVFITIIKIRKTAKISFITYLVILTFIVSNLYELINPGNIFAFSTIQLIAEILFIPYISMLAFGKPREETNIRAEIPVFQKPDAIIEEIEPEKIDLIEKGRAFVTLAADSFGAKDGQQNLLDTINRTCMEVTKADGGALLLIDDFDDVIAVKSFMGDFPPPYELPADLPHKPLRVSTSFKFAQFPLRDNIFGETAISAKPALITNPEDDSRVFQNKPEDFLKLGSSIYIPLRLRGKDIVIGVLALSRNPDKDPFTNDEFNWTQTLAGFAESALKTAFSFKDYKDNQELTKESDTATKLQMQLIPKKIPVIPGVSFGTFMTQTAGVCSDFYDVVPARSNRVSFLIMDVAGKGMTSLTVGTMLRSMMRLVINTPQSAGTILSWVNKGICGENTIDHFASAALINYDPTKKSVQIATGGTIPVLVYRADKNAIEKISASKEPVGVEKTTEYKDILFTVKSGDIIITYTDGLVEALNSEGKQYSYTSLSKVILANAKLAGKDIANKVKEDFKKFIGSEALHDDQTILLIKIQ
ncbi:MAG: SpoIIE family protein phosphatase [Treponema sp.]|nr:SpoIIE family protein phosphatase [Treponema sp.]